MKILGIDPGYDRLGLAVIEKKDGKEHLIFSSCFTTDPSLSFYDRLQAVGDAIKSVIEKHKPQYAAVETLLFNTNQKTVMRVAEVRGVIIYEAVRRGVSVYEYSPLQIKSALTGYGRSDKNQVTFMVGKLLSFNPEEKGDDECDAIAAALTASASITTPKNT